MPTQSQLVAFLIASFLLIELPGPSLLFAIGRALTAGPRVAILSVLGNALGLMFAVVLVALGLGALIAASSVAFTVLKLVGALYVVYLGVQAIRHRAEARLALQAIPDRSPRPLSGWASVRTGFVVGATNPKGLVFFAAFLPQFVDPGAPAAPQLLLLGLLFAVMATLSDGGWALLAGKARDWFGRKPERLDALGATGGVMMIGLGAVLVSSQHGS